MGLSVKNFRLAGAHVVKKYFWKSKLPELLPEQQANDINTYHLNQEYKRSFTKPNAVICSINPFVPQSDRTNVIAVSCRIIVLVGMRDERSFYQMSAE